MRIRVSYTLDVEDNENLRRLTRTSSPVADVIENNLIGEEGK